MNKIALSLITAIGITLSGICSSSIAAPGGSLAHSYDWTIEIDTQELPGQFQYSGSTIRQVVKTSLSYYSKTDPHPNAYEDLWYSNAHILGLERHNKLAITQGDAVAIKVKHVGANPSSPTLDEQRAAGKAIMKAVLDANINKNSVALISAPAASFHNIASEIQNYNFTPIDSSDGTESILSSDMNLFLQSDPPGSYQAFAHYR